MINDVTPLQNLVIAHSFSVPLVLQMLPRLLDAVAIPPSISEISKIEEVNLLSFASLTFFKNMY